MIPPEVKMSLRLELQHLPDVAGVGSREGTLLVYCSTDKVVNEIPLEHNGYPVEWVLTGPVRALDQD